MVLGRIGPDAIDADEALHKALQDENAEVRSAAQWALKQIEDL
jgi:HEAT repeat protein